jgi:thymidylate synthase ThyX
MKTIILEESGHEWAMLGLSLNKNQPVHKMHKVADKLAKVDGGHNKLLEHITVVLDITAPRYFWSEFDTYRVGISKNSESTMHTLVRQGLCPQHFEAGDVMDEVLRELNHLIGAYEVATPEYREEICLKIKRKLPEGFLQRRIVTTNYKTLRNMYWRRAEHRLPEWRSFCKHLVDNLKEPTWITERV